MTLPPTVHERLARCGTRVFVDGLVGGAQVELSVGGTVSTHTATGGAKTFTVPSLAAGASVMARQDEGAGFSAWSPAVIVEDALVPPQAAPVLPEEVGACSECVHVTHLVPDSRVKLFLGGAVVGDGRANRHGNACVPVDLTPLKGRRAGTLRARMYVCDAEGPQSATPIIEDPTLPKPVVGAPLYGCQRIVPLSNLRPGARVRMKTDTGTDLGSICSCWTAVNVSVPQALVVGEQVHARAYWSGKPCDAEGQWSAWQPVIAPDEGITPTVLEALVEGDQMIRVENQIIGATLVVKIRPQEGEPAEEFGPRPASAEQEIALNAPLVAGNVVSVVQTLCAVSFESDPVTVLPPPQVVHAPVVTPTLYACGAAVQVSNLHPGALARVHWNGIPIGLRWAGADSSISVPVAPTLVAGGTVTAIQVVGGIDSPTSDPPVPVVSIDKMQTPRILRPVALGDTTIWVSGVSPGAHVTIRSGGVIIGEVDAAEPITRVAVTPVTGPVKPTARLCSAKSTGTAVEPIMSPCAKGTFPNAGEEFRSFGTWMVPPTTDGGDFETRIEGQLYFPATGSGTFHPDARDLPLVVIAHGYWNPDAGSFTGYDYLARHLARWGMVVFSLNMDDVNNKTDGDRQQYSRGEIILRAVDLLLADSTWGPRINANRIGLLGHSMGGEGVVVAQLLNESEGRGYGIRGVVSIAPTHWRPEVILRETKYMQLLGSLDQLTSAMTGNDAAAHFSGFRIYDRAWRPKTHFWIYGARHNPFNRVWVADGDTYEEGIADIALPPQEHERIAKCLINAFFVNTLLGQSAYIGYMEGTILPASLGGLEIHTQHSKKAGVVLDNFGDADEQAPLADAALNKILNSLILGVSTMGTGLVSWDDVDHTSLDHSPHHTKGVRVSWDTPTVRYRSNTGGISRPLTSMFALRIGQFYQDEPLNPVAEPIDLFVTLSDGTNDATLRLGSVAQVPYPDSAGVVLCPMRTVRLPLDAFKAANPSFNHTDIRSVTLRLIGRATGDVLADDFEFTG